MFLQVCVCPRGGGGLSQHALQVVSQHALQQVSKWGCVVFQHTLQVSRPTPKGEVEGDLAGGGGSPGPHPRGGAVEGDQARVGSPGPHSKGKLRGIWPGGACSEVACSRGVPAPRGDGMPAPGGVWRPPP